MIIEGGHHLANFIRLVVMVSIATLPLTACNSQEPVTPSKGEQVQEEPQQEEEASAPKQIELEITSPAFQDGGTMPINYTCYGQDISPELNWRGVPEGTKSFTLIVDDLDAPMDTFTYWVLFNIPANTRELLEAVPTSPELSSGALHGKNDFGMFGYGGACPTWDTHCYHFVLYALDRTLDLPAGASSVQVLNTMQGHILAQAEFTVTYNR